MQAIFYVALRKESVDRNEINLKAPCTIIVALRKESVDRNDMAPYMVARFKMSLSARRAWIEILFAWCIIKLSGGSLSARRAWIEMRCCAISCITEGSSLSARRAWIEIQIAHQ